MTIEEELQTRLSEVLAQAGICVYQGAPAEDVLLLRWYVALSRSGDFARVFPEQPTAEDFLANFRAPVRLLYTVDDTFSISHAGWFMPITRSAALLAVWFAPTLRSSFRQLSIVRAALDYGLSTFDVILYASKVPAAVELTEALGFTMLGQVPYLFGPEPLTVGYLTRDNFKPLRQRKEA